MKKGLFGKFGLTNAERNQLRTHKHTFISRGERRRTLAGIEQFHKKNFKEIIKRLMDQFPGEKIIVLDDGAGFSSVKQELEEEFKERVRVIRTDLDKSVKPDHIASPEELPQKIGINSVHLVISTFGGVQYSPMPRQKVLAGIIEILKPGGEASIAYSVERGLGIKQITKRDMASLRSHYKKLEITRSDVNEPHWHVMTIKK